jgi:hypothetical protein
VKTAEGIAKSIRFSGEDESLPQTPLRQTRYTSPDWHEYDLEQVLGRRRLFVGHDAQIKRPGDFFIFRPGRENPIVSTYQPQTEVPVRGFPDHVESGDRPAGAYR